jgi:probable rRNA maturation factor
MASINFFIEDIVFKFSNRVHIRKWLKAAATQEGFQIKQLNYIFTSDQYLLSINREYLQHDTFTDIITFDQSEFKGLLEGDIFISVPRVKDNASRFNCSFERELSRVIIHGLLHLVGYSDKGSRQKQIMREKEDAYLSLLAI